MIPNSIRPSSTGTHTLVYWGVDVASGQLDLARHDRASVQTFDNSPVGIEQLRDCVQQHPPRGHCCGSHRRL